MLFTFKQFQQTKKQLVEEFHCQPIIQQTSSQHKENQYQYIKLLDSLRHRAKQKSKLCLNKINTARIPQNNAQHPVKIHSIRSAIAIKQKKSNPKKYAQNFSQPLKPSFTNFLSLQQKPPSDQFYLTGLLLESKVNEKQKEKAESQNQRKLTILSLEKEQDQIQLTDFMSGEAEQLVSLRVKIFEVGQQEKYLNEQINELQQSIRYYKQLNASLQIKLSDSTRKWNSYLKTAIRKQSDLNQRYTKNRQFEQKFMSTEAFFSKSLKSIKWNKNGQSRQCEEMIDDLAEKMLTRKFLEKKIQCQKMQIGKLQQKNKYKQKRIEESLNVCTYSHVLEKLINQLSIMKSNWYSKKEVSRHKKTASNGNFIDQFILKKLYELEESEFIHVVKDIIKMYNRLKSDEQKLRSIYEYKIYQLEEYRSLYQTNFANLNQCNEKNNPVESLKKVFSSKILQGKALQPSFKDYPSVEMRNICGDSFIDQIKKLQEKTKKANSCILGLQEKSKFLVKKLIKFSQKIIGRWLKYDQSALNFLANTVEGFVSIFSLLGQEISNPQIKEIMAEHFQNWQSYAFFPQEICNNALIHNSITQEEIVRGIRKSIKTKMRFKNTSTQKILSRLIMDWHSKFISRHYNMIEEFVKLCKEINHYCSKYQVFIVNIDQPKAKQVESAQVSNQDENQQPRKKKKSSNQPALNRKQKNSIRLSRMIKSAKNVSNQIESKDSPIKKSRLRQIDNEQPWDSEDKGRSSILLREKQTVSSTAYTLANLIMSYQGEINKISKIRKI